MKFISIYRKSGQSRDLIITRIKHPVLLDGAGVKAHERGYHDIQWTRIVEFELVLHPGQSHTEITEMDFGTSRRALRTEPRAGVAGQTLRRCCVDCRPDLRLRAHEYRLAGPTRAVEVRTALLASAYPSDDACADAIDAD